MYICIYTYIYIYPSLATDAAPGLFPELPSYLERAVVTGSCRWSTNMYIYIYI